MCSLGGRREGVSGGRCRRHVCVCVYGEEGLGGRGGGVVTGEDGGRLTGGKFAWGWTRDAIYCVKYDVM